MTYTLEWAGITVIKGMISLSGKGISIYYQQLTSSATKNLKRLKDFFAFWPQCVRITDTKEGNLDLSKMEAKVAKAQA